MVLDKTIHKAFKRHRTLYIVKSQLEKIYISITTKTMLCL